jgi:hypothetical protein
MLVKQWSFGDRVVHADRPEWGVGVVNAAASDSHEGKPSQRLTIRFDRAGVKTINSAVANLVPASMAPALPDARPADGLAEPDPLRDLGPSYKDMLLRLPDACTDPFVSPRARLDATLKLFRYGEHGGPLIDWACAQTMLKDPMTIFSRHDLEDLYRRFVQIRDEHLKKTVLELKKADPLAMREVQRTAPKHAQAALRRLDHGR